MTSSASSLPPDPVQAKLECLLFAATAPTNTAPPVNVIKQFCDCVQLSPSGPAIAARLLGHRLQSPQDHEALQALAVLEAVAKSCGPAFHAEVGKFRFLNEMIKLVSPKYLGTQRPEHVKQKIVELLFRWTKEILGEKKISEAYEMLKAQGVVKEDPDYVTSAVFAASLPPREPELDEEQQKRLQKLLQSKNQEDLQTANLMIRSLVTKDEERMERETRRLQQLQTVTTSVKLLHEMLDSFMSGGSRGEDRQLLAELSSSCERLRPGLYRMASDLAEDDSSIGEVLAASDEVTRALERYREVLKRGEEVVRQELLVSGPSPETGSSLLDLDPLSSASPASGLGDLRDLLPTPTLDPALDLMSGFGEVSNDSKALELPTSPTKLLDPSLPCLEEKNPRKGLHDLDLLGESLIRESLSGDCLTSFEARKTCKLPLNCLKKEPIVTDAIDIKDLTKELLATSTDTAMSETPSPKQTCDNDNKSSQDVNETKDDIETESFPNTVPKWDDIHIEMTKIKPNKAILPLQLQVKQHCY